MVKGRIIVDSNIHFGQPTVAGTRIPVHCVLELIEVGISFAEIKEKYYPDLAVEDIKACIRYAKDLVKSEEVHISEK